MSRLLESPPFAARDERAFIEEMNAITRWHLAGCAPFRSMWPEARDAATADQLPFVHVGVFKHLLMQTSGEGVVHQRTLTSSSTTGAQPSRITLDTRSSELQSASSLAILKELVGPRVRPLVVLDDVNALRQRGQVNARIAAAMSLKPLASEIQFVLGKDPNAGAPAVNDAGLRCVLNKHDQILVYGFTSVLWQAWAATDLSERLADVLRGKTIHFVHSGGWKKLESLKVDRARFDAALLKGLSPESRVIDYYGLVEQVGVIFPLCSAGFRHAPRWSGVIVRDPFTLKPLVGEPGMLQLMNALAWGAPYHNVLTEDMGRLVEGRCSCGWEGTRFELIGRVPKAEVRGAPMSEHRHLFAAEGRKAAAVMLPFELDAVLEQWGSLRGKMISGPPEEFTRDEWAYLISFLDPHTLEAVFEQTFGSRVRDGAGGGKSDAALSAIFRPRGAAAVWLPNNASLLGPLMLILISLTGSPVRAKAGSRAEDLAGAFVRYALQQLKPGPLRTYLAEQVRIEQFGREDPRNAELAAGAATRIIFGSDQAVQAVNSLAHVPASRMYAFADHRSEAWVHHDRLDDAAVVMLGRVFVIYGRAGCTSPARVVLLDGTLDQAVQLRDRMHALWARILPQLPAAHVASQNIMAGQLAMAQGWNARLAPNHAAALIAGEITLPEIPGFAVLPIIPATLEQCLATLPANIQTVGHLLREPHAPSMLSAVASRPIKRYVPLAQMHHFGPVWDGMSYWRELFEVVQVA